MQEIKPVTVVVTQESVTEQILALPPESIVVASPRPSSSKAGGSVLHRTGVTGWLVTRRGGLDVPSDRLSEYRTHEDIRQWVKHYEDQGLSFHLVRRGKDFV